MRKDIFIDNNIAKNFTNPIDVEYKSLIQWLLKINIDPKDDAYLVVSNKLIGEYNSSARDCFRGTSIPVIIAFLTQRGRLLKITNKQIKDFKKVHFTKKVERRLLSNEEDREHIPLVLLSDRKIALALDDNFIHDLKEIPGYSPIVSKRPEDISYND